MQRVSLASAIAVSLALALVAPAARADDRPLLPRRTASALDRALWLQQPPRVEVMSRAGGTALMIVGSVMVGGGWLVANSGLVAYAIADEPQCAEGSDCGMSDEQQVGVGMMIGGAVVCMTGASLLIYGTATRQRDTPPRRGPSRWGTGSLRPRSPLAFTF
jgi:hypothetical protein